MAGALGSAITSQASVARVLHAMGRDGILPRPVFGHVSSRFTTPDHAILAVNPTVIKHYFIDGGERGGGGAFNNIVLPAIGFLLTVYLWTQLSGLTVAVGLIWLAVGFVWLLLVTRGLRRPTPVLELEE